MTKFFTLSQGEGGVSKIPIFHSFVFHSLRRGGGGKVNDAIFTKSAVFFLMSSLSKLTNKFNSQNHSRSWQYWKFNLDFSSVVLFESLLFSLRNKQRNCVVDNECYAVHKVYLDILVLYQSIAFQKLNLKGNCFIVNILPLFVTLKEIEILFWIWFTDNKVKVMCNHNFMSSPPH